MISIQILKPKHLDNPRNAFVFTCEAMVGDGDEFHEFRLAPIYRVLGYESQLEELVNLLEAMDQFRWTENNSYSDLEHFDKWFPNADNADTDPFLYDGFIATLDSYHVSYFNREGIEHPVSITQLVRRG